MVRLARSACCSLKPVNKNPKSSTSGTATTPMMHKNQRGSALIIIVAIVAVVLLLILVGNIAVFTKDAANQLPTNKAEYLAKAEQAIAVWYRKNAIRIDAPDAGGTCPAFTEEQLFAETMLTRDFGARMTITPCLDVQGPSVIYRNVAIWIPAAAVQDTSGFTVSGVFRPGNSQVQYRLVNGHAIEAQMVAETRSQLQEMARAFELRVKAKIDGDPDRDLGINHFRSMSCDLGEMLPEEIPCSAAINGGGSGASGYVVLDDNAFKTLKLAQLTSISQSMSRDSWGQYIVFNNVLDDAGNVCLPEDTTTSTAATRNSRPPYRMMLQTITPWGAEITVCPVQPVN